jgi:hypothetical protein
MARAYLGAIEGWRSTSPGGHPSTPTSPSGAARRLLGLPPAPNAASTDHHLALLRTGDCRALLRIYADVRFDFPGDSMWSGELRGKEAMSRWLQRLVNAGLQNFADQVIVNGPP